MIKSVASRGCIKYASTRFKVRKYAKGVEGSYNGDLENRDNTVFIIIFIFVQFLYNINVEYT